MAASLKMAAILPTLYQLVHVTQPSPYNYLF